jgi:hypothetical protein
MACKLCVFTMFSRFATLRVDRKRAELAGLWSHARNILRYSRFIVLSPWPRPKMQSSWRLILALLCVFLVVATGTIQVVHAHPVGDISHADCSLCATAHVTVQVVEPPVTLFVTAVVMDVEAFVPLMRIRTFFTFALFTRPPPADTVLA